MVQGIKNARQFLSAPAWTDYILEPFGALANATTDAELEAYVHANAGPNWHMIGSACMSPRGADFGVVDPDLRVKGAVGLRVIDASVLVSTRLVLLWCDSDVCSSRVTAIRACGNYDVCHLYGGRKRFGFDQGFVVVMRCKCPKINIRLS